MTCVLAPLTATLLGYGTLRILETPWPRAALVGAACVLGPPLASLLLFLGLQTPCPPRVLAFGLLALALVLCAVSWRRPRPPRLGLGKTLVPAASFLFVGFVLVLRWLAAPAPDGDGLANFGVKARLLFAEAPLFESLRLAVMRPLHPDYPFHVPTLMHLGQLFGDTVDGLHALSGGVLIMPGCALFLSAMAARHGFVSGAVVGALMTAAPTTLYYASRGYADPHLAATLAVATVASTAARPPLAGALALGLLPWIKLEGMPHFLIVMGLFLWCRRGLGGRVWRYAAAALVIGLTWPLTMLLNGLWGMAQEASVPEPGGERLRVLVATMGELLSAPNGPLHLLPLAAALAAFARLLGAGRRLDPLVPTVFLALLVAGPALAFIRKTSTAHLSGPSGDVLLRLTLHALPLGLFTLGMVVAELFSSSPGNGGERRPGAT